MTSKLVIENAKMEDTDGIMELEKLGFEEGIAEKREVFEERICVFPKGFFVMKYEKKIIGYISTEIWKFEENLKKDKFLLNHSIKDAHNEFGEEIYISSMTIHPEFRGRGLAETLFDSILKKIKKEYPSVKSYVLIVNGKWKNAKRIYEKKGFQEIFIIEDFFSLRYKKCEDGIIMRKR